MNQVWFRSKKFSWFLLAGSILNMSAHKGCSQRASRVSQEATTSTGLKLGPPSTIHAQRGFDARDQRGSQMKCDKYKTRSRSNAFAGHSFELAQILWYTTVYHNNYADSRYLHNLTHQAATNVD